ncbi:MAG: hypothetical protein ACOX1P_02355 [Thermoguttaceae bacterium]
MVSVRDLIAAGIVEDEVEALAMFPIEELVEFNDLPTMGDDLASAEA